MIIKIINYLKKKFAKHPFISFIIILIIVVLFSVKLFILASVDAKLEFLGSLIGLPTSIFITIFSNDYLREKRYLDSIDENLYEMRNIVKDVGTLASRSYHMCNDLINSKSSNSDYYRLTLDFLFNNNEQIDDNVIQNLASNSHEFYKKRSIKNLHSNRNKKVKNLVKHENYKYGLELNTLYIKISMMQEGIHKVRTKSNKYNLSFLRNASEFVVDQSNKIKDIFTNIQDEGY